MILDLPFLVPKNPIQNGNDFHYFHIETNLLCNLTYYSLLQGLARLHCASRQRPLTVCRRTTASHQGNPVIFNDNRRHPNYRTIWIISWHSIILPFMVNVQ
jgi:hypothetical protein